SRAAESALHVVVELQVTDVAFLPPNSMTVAPAMNPVPVTTTLVPPAVGPPVGLTPVIVGANLKMSAVDSSLVPPAVLTVTSACPAASVGETALIDVAVLTMKLTALVERNLTAVAPLRFVPLIVTVVPPA